MHGAPQLPKNVIVAEGPAKIVNGKVRVFACTRDQDSKAALGSLETIARLHESTPEDDKEQELIRKWRIQALQQNTEALGVDYLEQQLQPSLLY